MCCTFCHAYLHDGEGLKYGLHKVQAKAYQARRAAPHYNIAGIYTTM